MVVPVSGVARDGRTGASAWPGRRRRFPVPAGRSGVRRVAIISVHTSPLDQPGTGDAGGMNVYTTEVARRLAAAGVEVEIFTRATSSEAEPVREVVPGVLVRHVVAGPFDGLTKEDLPAQLCAFTHGVLRAEARQAPGWYDVVHSHYWLSGQVGWLAKDRWGVPLVHSAHTLARVKNAQLATEDRPEPHTRVIGEDQVVAVADRLVANTASEAGQLTKLYGAPSDRVSVVTPGVDLERFTPAASGCEDAVRRRARRALRLPERGPLVTFVGRVQPLKGPEVLLRAMARLRERAPALADEVNVAVVGGPSGSGLDRPTALAELAGSIGTARQVHFLPPQTGDALAEVYRASDLVAVPSCNESFGLVALEAQACGVPVVAAAVGGLVTAVRDGVSGVLIDGHDPGRWAEVLESLLSAPQRRAELARGACAHARRFSWDRTAKRLLSVYGEAVAVNQARRSAQLVGM